MFMNVTQVENLALVHTLGNQYGIYRTFDGKEGIITLDGEIILPAKDYMGIIPLFDNLFDLVIDDIKHTTFNANRKEMLPLVIRQKTFAEQYIFVQQDSKLGICDRQFHILLPAEYERIVFYASRYWLKTSKRWIVLNEKLEKCYSDVDDLQLLIGAKAKDDSVAVDKDGEYYLLSSNGKRLTKGQYDFLQPFTEAGYALAKIDGKFVVIDENEQVLCRTEYTMTYDDSLARPYWRLMWVSVNRLAFYEDGKFGLMAPNGKVIVPPTYAEITVLGHENLIPVKSTEGLRGYIDVDGKVIVPCNYKYVVFKKKINQFIIHTTEMKYGLLDRNRHTVLPSIYKHIDVDKNGRILATIH